MLAVVDPTSDIYYTWLEVLMLAVMYNVLVIIVRCVFLQHVHLDYQSTWLTCAGGIHLSDVLVYLADPRLHL